MRLLPLLLATACGAPAPVPTSPMLHPTPTTEDVTHEDHEGDHHSGEHHRRFDDVERWSAIFDSPERQAWQKPDDLMAALPIQEGDTVIDIGAGTGYFNSALAAMVGAQGQLIAADIETTLVEHMTVRAQAENTPNVLALVIDATHPTLPIADVALMVDTYHHITDRPAYFAHIGAQLGRHHRLVIVDFQPGELPVGPGPDHKLAPGVVTTELTTAGYILESANDELLPYQFVHTYRWDPTLTQLNAPPDGWTDLRALLPQAQFDIRYHTADNFTGSVLPGYGAEGAWLRDEPAQALSNVHTALAEHGLGVKVYDAYRPLRGTLGMVAWAKRTDQVHLLNDGYIARRSGHNKGNTIDLSLYNLSTGQEQDMGTAWDTLSEESHTRNATGEALERRLLLKSIMAEHGFHHYYKEWWHFTFKPDAGLTHRDVPYGCFETAEGEWTAPEGWDTPGFAMPTAWEPHAPCDAAPAAQ
ncbi:MAG: D-alanyl-D-alanine dipeptidase [Myxococcota bacterium]